MVWGGNSYTGRTDLTVVNGNLTATRYMKQIVDPHITPFLNANGPGFVRQQDITNVVRTHFQHNNANIFPWSAVSPDITPIEHVWDELDRPLRKRPVQPRILAELAQALQEEWVNMHTTK